MSSKPALIGILMVLVVFCAMSFAKYSGGTGEPNTPYLIATPNDLNSIGLDANDWDKHFLMTADINMAEITGTQYNVIGDYPRFTGVFDGNDHSITNFTYGISWSGGSLIRHVDSPAAAVKNVIMIDADVNEPGDGGVACLVGRLYSGQVSNCHIINGKINAENFSGLLVGINESQVIDCSASGFCSGNHNIGGLVGDTRDNGSIVNSYSDCNIVAERFAGGLTGENTGSVVNCYSYSNVTIERDIAGGIVGWNDGLITNCFSKNGLIQSTGNDVRSKYVGGLVGYNVQGQVIDSFSDNTVKGKTNIGGLVGANDSSATIENCYSLGSVDANDNAGGLVGGNWGIITTSFADANVTVSGNEAGGLCGSNHNAEITNSYSMGVVSGDFQIGGLVGLNYSSTIANCFSITFVNGITVPGGFCGKNMFSNIFNSFWDIETSGLTDGDGGPTGTDPNITGLPTAQMKIRSTFADAGWDMVDVWDIGENQTYPFLRTHLPSDINKDDETNLYDFSIIALNWLAEK